MKKIILLSFILLIIITGTSFFYAKKTAKNLATNQKEDISPLNGGLLLFFDDKFKPCWHFKGEYLDLITGATFDVFISFTGNRVVLKNELKFPGN